MLAAAFSRSTAGVSSASTPPLGRRAAMRMTLVWAGSRLATRRPASAVPGTNTVSVPTSNNCATPTTMKLSPVRRTTARTSSGKFALAGPAPLLAAAATLSAARNSRSPSSLAAMLVVVSRFSLSFQSNSIATSPAAPGKRALKATSVTAAALAATAALVPPPSAAASLTSRTTRET